MIGLGWWSLDSERVACVDLLFGPKYEVPYNYSTTQLLAYTFIAETVHYIS